MGAEDAADYGRLVYTCSTQRPKGLRTLHLGAQLFMEKNHENTKKAPKKLNLVLVCRLTNRTKTTEKLVFGGFYSTGLPKSLKTTQNP